MLTIVPDPPTPTQQAQPRLVPLLLVEAPELDGDLSAELAGTTLRISPTATEAEQLAAIRDAVTYLWTADRGGRARLALPQLAVVTS